jgi:phosphate transport system permease protein
MIRQDSVLRLSGKDETPKNSNRANGFIGSLGEGAKVKAQRSTMFNKHFRLGEFLAENFIKAVSFTSFAFIVLIFVFVFREALPIFSPHQAIKTPAKELQQETYGDEPAAPLPPSSDAKSEGKPASLENTSDTEGATLSNLLGKDWQPVSSEPKFGLLPLIVGSFKVTIISVLIGAPLAILAALYTAFFASKRLKLFLKVTIEFLSGFPSVVIGFFALVEIATLFQNLFGYEYRLNAFVGGFALSLVAIPIIYTVTDDAITAIPKFLTEGSLALGATKWQTAFFVVLPAATPGIFAALLLGIGRAFGETMIVLMATGNAALMSFSFFKPVRTMSATIGAEMAEVVFGDTHYNVLFLIGSILFIFTFTIVAVAEFYVRGRLMKRFRGES